MTKKIFFTLLLGTFFAPLMATSGYVQPIGDFHQYQVTHQRSSLPAVYDSRDQGWVLPARDQLIDGTCWAFTCANTWQILLHKNGINTGYLSPQALTTCFTGFLLKPVIGGGNTQVANSLLARLEGVVYNKSLPYDPTNTTCKSYEKKDIPAYILGWNYLPEGDITAIKEHILSYGAVSANFCYDLASHDFSQNMYCYNGEEDPNHAITLIGWDDTKRAWLAQNSWGNSGINQGYLWISYLDKYINNMCTAYTNYTDVNSIDNVYHYTSTGMIGGYGIDAKVVSDGIVEYDFKQGEELVAIGTGIRCPNLRVSFTVIDLEAGQYLYTSPSVIVPYAGFYKHELEKPLKVSGKICVAVTYYSTYEKAVLPIEGNREGLTSVVLHNGNQWMDFNEKGEWIPLGNQYCPFNLCIYAYTKNSSSPVEESQSETKRAFYGGQLTTDIWEVASRIHVYSIDGKLHKTLSSADATLPSLVTGVYLLVVEKQDGSRHTEKIWIQ